MYIYVHGRAALKFMRDLGEALQQIGSAGERYHCSHCTGAALASQWTGLHEMN